MIGVSHSVIDVVGADSVPGDLANQNANPDRVLPTFYGSEDFGFTVQFSVFDDDGLSNLVITSVGHTANRVDFYNRTYSTNSIAFTKNFTPFDEYWDFRIAENDVRRLLPYEARELGFETITSWNQPSEKVVEVNHTFTINYDTLTSSGSVNYTMDQYYYWYYLPSLNEFQALVSEGRF